jgi:phosphoribosylglycinamide formyltransferase-1
MEAIKEGRVEAEVRIVISDVGDAGILKLAREFHVPSRYVPPGRFRTKLEPEIEQEIVRILRDADVELVVLAGFMRVLKQVVLNAFAGHIINIHPSLLPKFRGLEAWTQALDAREQVTGCTVHYVDAGVDTGEILGQKTVPILPNDTPERLHARIQAAEHALLPSVIAGIARKRSS